MRFYGPHAHLCATPCHVEARLSTASHTSLLAAPLPARGLGIAVLLPPSPPLLRNELALLAPSDECLRVDADSVPPRSKTSLLLFVPSGSRSQLTWAPALHPSPSKLQGLPQEESSAAICHSRLSWCASHCREVGESIDSQTSQSCMAVGQMRK